MLKLTPTQVINMTWIQHYFLNKLHYISSLEGLKLDNLEVIRVRRDADAIIFDTVKDPFFSTRRPWPLVSTQLIFNARMRPRISVYEIPHPTYDVSFVRRDPIISV